MSKRSEKQRQRARRARRDVRRREAAAASAARMAELMRTMPKADPVPGFKARVTFEDWINSLEERPGPPPLTDPIDPRGFRGATVGGPMMTIEENSKR